MPAQTQSPQLHFYTQWDSAPDLEDTLYERDGKTPIDLTGTEVYFTMAHALGSTYYLKSDPVVDHELCTIIGDPVDGVVAWSPSNDSLYVVGFFDYQFTIVYPNTKQRTVKSYTYQHVRIQAPPGGRTHPQWTPGGGPT